MSSEKDLLIRRIERLEQQNQRMKKIGIFALLLAVAVIVMGQTPKKIENGENESITLRDKNGRNRINIDADGGIILTDKNGKTGILLSSKGIALMDENRQSRIIMETGKGISFYDSQGNPKSSFNEESLIYFGDDCNLTLKRNDLWMLGKEGDVRVTLKKGNPLIAITDSRGFKTNIGVSELTTIKTGENHTTSASSVVLFDKEGDVIWKAP
jgi:hypothetical protein